MQKQKEPGPSGKLKEVWYGRSPLSMLERMLERKWRLDWETFSTKCIFPYVYIHGSRTGIYVAICLRELSEYP